MMQSMQILSLSFEVHYKCTFNTIKHFFFQKGLLKTFCNSRLFVISDLCVRDLILPAFLEFDGRMYRILP